MLWRAGRGFVVRDLPWTVEKLLAAKAKLPTAKTERDREFYTNKCATLDQQIDALVYELYGLTEAEIKPVEGGQ
jgi:hypothetical protein